MLINALCDYYDLLVSHDKSLPEKDRKILEKGYSRKNIHFLISLSASGEIKDIIDLRKELLDNKGKVIKQPRAIVMPERVEISAIHSNFIEHRAKYIFGFEIRGEKTLYKKTEHEDFIKRNMEYIEGIDTPTVNAYRNFMMTWTPEEGCENPKVLALGNEQSNSNYVFCLDGQIDNLLHNDPKIKERWKEIFKEEPDDCPIGQCAITGENKRIAIIHRKIRNIKNGSSYGNTLVNFNSDAECSYGKQQSANSNISYQAMKKYTDALNYLLNSSKNSTVVDDTTFIHWSTLNNENNDMLFTEALWGGDDTNETTRDDIDGLLKDVLKARASGKADFDMLKEKHDISGDYYIAGLKPSDARISVKCIYKNDFGNVLYNMAKHQEDIRVQETEKLISFQRIYGELLKTCEGKLESALVTRLFDSIINNKPYPDALLYLTLDRIKKGSQVDKIEKDKSGKEKSKYNDITPLKVGLLKGYLNRKARFNNQEEEFTLALNKENTNPAYLCGRLFSVLENTQRKATPKLNKTIKDTYFSAAMTRPANVFPILKKLNIHHLAKLDNANYIEKEMAEIIDMLGDDFPTRLNSAEQGTFVIGYYQQEQYRFNAIKTHKESMDSEEEK